MTERTPEIKWTDSQLAALEAPRINLLISAAAGSGKTAVLTERIFRLLTDPVDPIPLSQIVAITFTRAAAASLKDKLARRLRRAEAEDPQNKHIRRLLLELPHAQVSTVHSFCHRIILENASVLGLPAKLSIGSETRVKALKIESMTDALNRFLAGRPDGEILFSLSHLFSVTDDDPEEATALLLKLYEELSCLEDGVEHLGELCEKGERELDRFAEGELPFFRTDAGMRARAQLLSRLSRARKKLDAYFHEFPEDERENDLILPSACELSRRLDTIMNLCREEDLEGFRRALELCGLPNYRNNSETILHKSPEGDALHKRYLQIRGEISEMGDDFSAEPGEYLAGERQRLKLQRAVYTILAEFERIYKEKKLSLGILDYSDLEHYALAAISRPDAPVYCRALFVDEYQDTNRLQDIFFRKCVAKGGFFFFVGDVKQSIYRFRYAAPDLFLSYKKEFPPLAEALPAGAEAPLGRSIFFAENFRSDETIINFSNDIFHVLMNDQEDEDRRLYSAEDRLRRAKRGELRDLPTELYLIDRDKPQTANEYDLCAKMIARELEDGRAPEEIAVIAPANKSLDRAREVLSASGIPVSSGETALLDEPEVYQLEAILTAVNDPLNDSALAALCTSPLFSFSSDELSDVRRYAQGAYFHALTAASFGTEDDPLACRAREVLGFLDTMRSLCAVCSVPDVILHLLENEGFLGALAGKNRLRREHLMRFHREAVDFTAEKDHTLPAFLDYIRKKREQNSPTSSDGQIREGCVTLMTVHKSKGLEFPVCIFLGIGRTFRASSEPFFDRSLGLFARISDPGAGATVTTLPEKIARRDRHTEALEETKRLLYVGITRAVEKLIVIYAPAYPKNVFAAAQNAGVLPYLEGGAVHSADLASAGEMLLYSLRDAAAFRQIVSAYYADRSKPVEGTCGSCRVTILPALTPCAVRYESGAEDKKALTRYSEEELEAIRLCLAAEARRRAETYLPAKLSVSELMHLTDGSRALSPTHLSFEAEDRRGAEAGIAMHAFLQFCDFASAAENAEAEAARLADRAFLTEAQAKGLNFFALSRFFASPTYEKMRQSPRLRREMRFNVFLPAEKILPGEREGEVLVQGVIDCFYEKKDGTYAILDFKTDHVPKARGEEILRARHAKQLKLYALALKEMTGKEVTSAALYSFALAREIDIPLTEDA